MISIGIVGCGTIGSSLALAIQEGRIPARLAGRTRSRAETLARSLTPAPPLLDLPHLVQSSDLVAEAASVAAVAEIVPACLQARKDVCVISAGGPRMEMRRNGETVTGDKERCAVTCRPSPFG